jgi:hypothetical protein
MAQANLRMHCIFKDRQPLLGLLNPTSAGCWARLSTILNINKGARRSNPAPRLTRPEMEALGYSCYPVLLSWDLDKTGPSS